MCIVLQQYLRGTRTEAGRLCRWCSSPFVHLVRESAVLGHRLRPQLASIHVCFVRGVHLEGGPNGRPFGDPFSLATIPSSLPGPSTLDPTRPGRIQWPFPFPSDETWILKGGLRDTVPIRIPMKPNRKEREWVARGHRPRDERAHQVASHDLRPAFHASGGIPSNAGVLEEEVDALPSTPEG